MLIFLICGLASMTIVIDGQCMAVVLPAAKCDLGLSTAQQGFINSVAYIGIIVSAHFWGFIIDTWGRKNTLQLTLAMSLVCSVTSSFAVNSWMLIVFRFLVGIW